MKNRRTEWPAAYGGCQASGDLLDLDKVCRPADTDGDPGGEDDGVAARDHARTDGGGDAGVKNFVGGCEVGAPLGDDAPGDAQLPADPVVLRQGDDGAQGAEPGDHPRRMTRGGDGDDGAGGEVHGRRAAGVADGVADGRLFLKSSSRKRFQIDGLFGGGQNFRHGADTLQGIPAGGRLAGEHHAAGSVKDGGGYVADLRAGGARVRVMLSSICVATMTGLPLMTQAAMMFFWMMGTSQALISTPRSPRATITASEATTISAILSTPSRFSISR